MLSEHTLMLVNGYCVDVNPFLIRVYTINTSTVQPVPLYPYFGLAIHTKRTCVCVVCEYVCVYICGHTAKCMFLTNVVVVVVVVGNCLISNTNNI